MYQIEWMPADGLELEKNAERVIKSNDNEYVIAGPGAGKTELLAQRADYLLRTNICKAPRRILAISFKRDSAKNIKDRVERRCGIDYARRFVSYTYDAFTKMILDHFIYSLPEEYRPSLDYDIAFKDSEILKTFEILGYKFSDNKNKIQAIRSLTEFPFPFSNYKMDKYEWVELIPNVWNICLKGDNGYKPKISFKMVARLSDFIIRTNPKIHKSLITTFSHVFLDEFQDTTTLQYEFIKTCFKNTNTILTAVGDDKQRIMVWAGADRKIFEKFERDFNAEKIPLFMNFRSAPRLIEIQKIISQHLSSNNFQVEPNKKWGKEDGICEIWNFKNPNIESLILADKIEEWLEKEEISPKDICVIVKQKSNKYGIDLIEALNKKKIIARDESKLQDLLAEDCVLILLDLVTLAYSSTARDEWFRTIKLIKFLRCINLNYDLEGQKFRKLEYEINSKLTKIKNDFSNIKNISELELYLWKILKDIGLNEIKTLFPQYRRGPYLNNLMRTLIDSLWKEYAVYNKWDEAIAALIGNKSIPIMTIHKSKGLEYDTVLFLGLEDQAFWSFKTQSEEDTCAFYVALSRAKRRVIFTFCNVRNTGFNDNVERQTKKEISSLYELLEKSKVVKTRQF